VKHQVHSDEDVHRREHLHFRTVNLQPAKRHNVRHKGTAQDITSESEKGTPQTPTSKPLHTLHTDDVSITSNNELTLFPPIPEDEDQLHNSILFGTSIPDEIPIVSIHHNYPESESTILESTTMETTV